MDKLVYELFKQEAGKNSENVALIDKEKQYSYDELNRRANYLASLIQAKNSSEVIGILLDRSVDMVESVWAVIMSGHAYLPIDPSLPHARVTYMLENSNVRTLLTSNKYANCYRNNYEIVCLEEHQGKTHNQQIFLAFEPDSVDAADRLAYVMYTSGTTGRPKGVKISHHSLVGYVLAMQDIYPLASGERVLFKTPFNFDVSVREIIWTLCFGGTLVIAEPEGHKDPVYISELMEEYRINLVHFVPSMLDVFLRHPGTHFSKNIKCVICSGEALQINHVETFYQKIPYARLLNMYGPTEATVEVSAFDCANLKEHPSVPIGRVIANNKLLILNDDMTLCKQNEMGKLYISGDSLALGYMNNEKLTQQKFITHHVKTIGLIRLYETGDIARYLDDGNIEYIGREDDQLNIRGYRIELNEIKNIIMSHRAIENVYVTAHGIDTSLPKIVAYITKHEYYDKANVIGDLFDFLKTQLPEYMIPGSIILIDELPLTANGKIDRNSLPEPTALFNKKYLEPTNDIEKRMLAIWGSHLNVNRQISIDDNYFRLGGDSLSLIHIVKGINSEFKTSFLSLDFIGCETIEEQSDVVARKLQARLHEVSKETTSKEKWDEFEL
ncbi:non-ribosomal peptide synthetase [Aliikangiella coralliicola]|uniref:Non-ribosomal peptide synthetase n=1 Tax=Aliikangiella coralliicola TaxID=2592383 RepID=A0A545TV70_9GAMM|nr:non-ribosomal peptide synthetase [Aliikangiella coralliicola]TQV81104.1 non-ribosomal peptide synthetase [Aliikangiella coralliicola]